MVTQIDEETIIYSSRRFYVVSLNDSRSLIISVLFEHIPVAERLLATFVLP
jgi:hypothetical protein